MPSSSSRREVSYLQGFVLTYDPMAIGTVMLALGLALASQAATQAARHQPDGVCLPAPHKVAAGLGPLPHLHGASGVN
jgi:hypothetical protein